MLGRNGGPVDPRGIIYKENQKRALAHCPRSIMTWQSKGYLFKADATSDPIDVTLGLLADIMPARETRSVSPTRAGGKM